VHFHGAGEQNRRQQNKSSCSFQVFGFNSEQAELTKDTDLAKATFNICSQ
jgi:hypothetical protein